MINKVINNIGFDSGNNFRCCLVYRGQKEKKVPKTAKGGVYKAMIKTTKIIRIYIKKILSPMFSSITKALID